MAKKKKKARKRASSPQEPLTRKEKKHTLALAQQLNREVPWLIYRHRDKMTEDVQWELSEAVRDLRLHLKKPRKERDLATLKAQVDALDGTAQRHLGAVRKSPRRRYTESMVVALLIALFIRTFLFEPFKIPSGSMIPTLMVGDRLFVSKFIYGINLPFTDVMLLDWRKPVRGEVIVFEHPNPRPDGGDILIKRVMAVSGDHCKMVNNVWHINGKVLGKPKVLSRHTSCISQPDESCEWIDTMKGGERPRAGCPCTLFEESDSGYTWVTQHISPQAACVCRTPEPEGDRLVEHLVLNSPDWPNNGEEGVVPEGHVLVLGDNRDSSDDGRFWGTVPLPNIKGKAQFLWLATQDFWGRWFRKIH